MTTITEADVEAAALAWLSGLGWGVAHGPDIAPDAPGAERTDYGQVILERDGCATPSHFSTPVSQPRRWTTHSAG